MLRNLNLKQVVASAILCCLSCISLAAEAPAAAAPAPAPAAAPAPAFPDLLARVRAERTAIQAISKEREARFRSAMEDQRKLNADAQQRRNAAEARTNRLDGEFAANEKRIDELNALLTVNQGNLGELFGVTRQIAADALGQLSSSLNNVQLANGLGAGAENRLEFMRRMSAASELPNILDLERMWLELMTEMKMDSEVARFTTPVLQNDGITSNPTEVVRIGSFMAYGNNEYLVYLPSEESLSQLTRQPAEAELMQSVRDVLGNTSGSGYMPAIVDPARGALLSMYVERPDFIERIEEGEKVNYVIVGVGFLGVFAALFQYVYLIVAKVNVAAQVKKMSSPSNGNALGRLLLSVQGTEKDSPEVVELRISEAVLREIPKLERFQSFLRLAVSAGPLLGLIGTVIGMIITFESITASGSSDPKLMAQGIGAAMIATVLGLGIAIPLLFLNAGLVSLSKSVIHVLEEESTSLLAKRLQQH
jgi:biopolymer transport protein ExbB